MVTQTGRDDFIIAARSAFLNKGTRQKFSLFTLLIISILILSLEYFKTGPIDKMRSVTKDVIFLGSKIVSLPFVFINDKYLFLKSHISMYEEYENLKIKKINTKNLEYQNQFYKSENERLKKLIGETSLSDKTFLLAKILLDQQSPYLKSVLVNKGFKNDIKNGSAVLESYYYIGKIVDVNHLTSRVLLASDLNSKIPIIIEPGGINAILSGAGNDNYANLEYLPKINQVSDGNIAYTSGIDGDILEAVPVGTVVVKDQKKMVKFFVDFNQLKFVKVNLSKWARDLIYFPEKFFYYYR